MGAARATVDHDAIQAWVDERGGHPARVKATESGEDPGILRIDFPGFSGEDLLEEIPWDEFFTWFDGNDLALLLSEEEGNRFNKFVDRSSVASPSGATARSAPRRGRTAGRRAASPENGATVGRKSRSSTKRTSSKASSGDTRSASRRSPSRSGPSSKKLRVTRASSQSGSSANEGSKRPSVKATRRSSPARTASATKRAAVTTPRSTTTKRVAGRSTVSRSASSRKK